MEDKRKQNGGHSTAAKKATDKRLNPNKKMLERYIEEGFDYEKLTELMNTLFTAAKQGDTKAATLFLNYVIGKPKETIKHEGSVNIPLAQWLEE